MTSTNPTGVPPAADQPRPHAAPINLAGVGRALERARQAVNDAMRAHAEALAGHRVFALLCDGHPDAAAELLRTIDQPRRARLVAAAATLMTIALDLDRPHAGLLGQFNRAPGMPERTLYAARLLDLVLAGRDEHALTTLHALDEQHRVAITEAATTLAALGYEVSHPPVADPGPAGTDAPPLSPGGELHVAAGRVMRAARATRDPIAGVDPQDAGEQLAAVGAVLHALTVAVGEIRTRVVQSYPAANRGRYVGPSGAAPTVELRTAEHELRDVETHLAQLERLVAKPAGTLGALHLAERQG